MSSGFEKAVSISEIKAHNRCKEYHHYAYSKRMRPRTKSAALNFGTLFHLALECWWKSPLKGEARLEEVSEFISANEGDEFDRAKARALMFGYHLRWCDYECEVLGVETDFRFPLPDAGVDLHGKIDAIVRDTSGRVLIIEHKTSSEDISAGSKYWQKLAMDAQISAYIMGARSLGYEVHECLYDVIFKPALYPLKATLKPRLRKDGQPYSNQRAEDETPDQYQLRLMEAIAARPNEHFQRAEIPRTKREMALAMRDITGAALAICGAGESSYRNTAACFDWGRACEYLGVCSGERSINDDALYELVISKMKGV